MEALYEFKAGDENELDMKKGDRIIIVDETDQNWWMGRNPTTGKEGLIPKPYIKVIKQK